MTETDYKFFQLLWSDPKIGTVIGRICLIAFIVSIILERRTKLKPWTRMVQWIGRVANSQIIDRVDKLDAKVDRLQKCQEEAKAESERSDIQMKEDMDLRKAEEARRRILRFSDEIINHIPHSREMFNDILEDCDTYESYYRDHPNVKNGRAREAVSNVKDCFHERCRKNDFLVGRGGPSRVEDEDTY